MIQFLQSHAKRMARNIRIEDADGERVPTRGFFFVCSLVLLAPLTHAARRRGGRIPLAVVGVASDLRSGSQRLRNRTPTAG
jgi:hypothetical protein